MGRVAFFGVVALVAVVLSSGCMFGGVYSKQDYGPQVMMPPSDASVAELIKRYGAPDEQIDSGDAKVFVYRKLEGMQVLGVFGTVKKTDLIFVARGGKIVDNATVPRGEALTILGIFAAPVYGPGVVNQE
jgi:hypothetical protein